MRYSYIHTVYYLHCRLTWSIEGSFIADHRLTNKRSLLYSYSIASAFPVDMFDHRAKLRFPDFKQQEIPARYRQFSLQLAPFIVKIQRNPRFLVEYFLGSINWLLLEIWVSIPDIPHLSTSITWITHRSDGSTPFPCHRNTMLCYTRYK